MLHHHVDNHPVHKYIQKAFSTVESGLALYNTAKGAIQLGQTIFRGAQSAYQIAAPLAGVLL